MADKPLQLVNGIPTEVEATVTSAGAGNAGDVVALDGSGKLDSSVLPAGVGQNTDSIASFENLAAGDFVNVFDDSGTIKCRKADANADKPAHGFVLAAVTAPAAATIYGPGELNSQLSSLTLGALYFLSETAGGVTTTPPASSGAVVQPLGVAKSTTALRFLNQGYYKRA